ncbi:hypothetical protein PIB30_028908 [Stylosanthes scabra]|uniref:Amino acid transporter transmembrane domain-containing protein n=1 Tax=Stylosanthes scabra TaxID=79078 RepID=A0ABU6ZB00_9FABA|nr:hypothetical protein [Stylosanthes scabra]
MIEEAIDDESPLIQSFSSTDILGGPSKRTGSVWSAVTHIITGVIGAGVLSLAWAVAQLGWIAGPSFLMLFASITVVSSYLLSDCYRFPDPQHGNIRNPSYMLAVKIYLGERKEKICGVLVHASLFGTNISYVITAATSIKNRELKPLYDGVMVSEFNYHRHQMPRLAPTIAFRSTSPLIPAIGRLMRMPEEVGIKVGFSPGR